MTTLKEIFANEEENSNRDHFEAGLLSGFFCAKSGMTEEEVRGYVDEALADYHDELIRRRDGGI